MNVPLSEVLNKSSKNESSYHLNTISFEDSHVEHFHAYCSPSVLMRQGNKSGALDESDVERGRGYVDLQQNSLATTKFGQSPLTENTTCNNISHSQWQIHDNRDPLIIINDKDEAKNSLKISSMRSIRLEETISYENSTKLSQIYMQMVNESKEELDNKMPQKRLEFLDITQKSDVANNSLNKKTESDENQQPLKSFSSLSISRQVLKNETQDGVEKKTLSSCSSLEISKTLIDKNSKSIRSSAKDRGNHNKENLGSQAAKSEAATQTSFIKENVNRLSVIQTESIHKQRLKQLIQIQKHEKKYRELERLAKCELLEAQRIRKKMLESEIDASLILADSTLNLSEIFGPKQGSRYSKLTHQHAIENTTVDDLTTVSSVKSVLEGPNSTVNETKEDVFEVSTNETLRPPKSVVIVKENNLGQARSQRKETSAMKRMEYPKNVVKMVREIKTRPCVLEIDNNEKMSEKMSLQEAFKTYKNDVIERSKKRQMMIEERARRRKEVAEKEKNLALEMNWKLKEEKMLAAMNSKKTNFFIGQKRRLSVNEIKEITRKNYEKLPEVKQKQLLNNLEKSKRLNRIRSNIYNKVIQNHLLTKGPNFHLNYKALTN